MSQAPVTFLYIASCSHSGSTLLDMLLSSHPEVCGLGETAMLIMPGKQKKNLQRLDQFRCSCGEMVADCDLWSAFFELVQANPDLGVAETHRQLVRLTRKNAPGTRIISDSSKYVKYLRMLLQTPDQPEGASLYRNQDLAIIHLVRDARGYVSSLKRRFNISDDDSQGIERLFQDWYTQNRSIEKGCRKLGVRRLTLSYEEMCIDPVNTITHVCREAGLDDHPNVGQLALSRSHVGLGNPMRNHETRSQVVQYDRRWFHDRATNKIYQSLDHVCEINERLSRQSIDGLLFRNGQ